MQPQAPLRPASVSIATVDWHAAHHAVGAAVQAAQGLGARINVRGTQGSRTVPMSEFMLAAYTTVLEAAQFKVARNTAAVDRDKLVTLEATAALEGGGSERISVRVTGQGATTMVHLDYSHEEPGAGEALEK